MFSNKKEQDILNGINYSGDQENMAHKKASLITSMFYICLSFVRFCISMELPSEPLSSSEEIYFNDHISTIHDDLDDARKSNNSLSIDEYGTFVPFFEAPVAHVDDNRALLEVAAKRNSAQVETALAHNASPNIQDNKGRTALFLAARNGSIKIVNLLLKQGADCNMPNNQGWTPLHSAAQNGRTTS